MPGEQLERFSWLAVPAVRHGDAMSGKPAWSHYGHGQGADEMNVGAPLTFSVLFRLRPWSVGWPQPHSGRVLLTEPNLTPHRHVT